MVQTDLKSDNFCGYNTSAAPFHWIMDPTQVEVQFNAGEVGVPSGVGLHTPGEVIGVSTFLSDRGNYLTSCIPPRPNMLSKNGYESDASITGNGPTLETQGFELPHNNSNEISDRVPLHVPKMTEHFTSTTNYSNKSSTADGTVIEKTIQTTDFLLPNVQNSKRSAIDLSAIDFQGGFSGNAGNLFTEPQNLTYVIERMWLQRGGIDQNQEIKKAYEYGEPNDLNICNNIRKPYNIKYPFGLPTTPDGKSIYGLESKQFTANDVVAMGSSSPQYQQNNQLPFNYNAGNTNGGCNNISVLKDNLMCSNVNNDLTGFNNFNFRTELPPPGVTQQL